MAEQLGQLGLFVGGAAGEVPGAITVYDNTQKGPNGPELTDAAQLNSLSQAFLVGVSGAGEALCTSCSFLKWGAWLANLDFQTNQGVSDQTPTHQVQAAGWFVSGDLTTVGQIDTLAANHATASYTGNGIGNVASLQDNTWNTYVATGGLNMNWNFAQRNGDLTISNFDNRSYGTGQGGLTQPVDINKFSGTLSQIGGPMTGNATGSFVNNGPNNRVLVGVIGNFNVHGDGYGATGVFGAGPAPTCARHRHFQPRQLGLL